jgi:pimeloyl-ACP methyl ester carboxylesterase
MYWNPHETRVTEVAEGAVPPKPLHLQLGAPVSRVTHENIDDRAINRLCAVPKEPSVRVTYRCWGSVAAIALTIVPYAAAANWCSRLTDEQLSHNSRLAAKAAEFASYAILSNDAYGGTHEQLPLPPDWSRSDFQFVDPGNTGLALAVFEHRDKGKLAEVVVSFRGTDDCKDWETNLEPWHRIQIKPAEDNFKAIVERYRDSNARIVVTGHSLGGGLALHISFHNPGVDAVVFDASPVAKPGLHPAKASRVSIWESGEALEAPRESVRIRWPNTTRLEYRFVHGLPIDQHSMPVLAANLVKLGATRSPVLADFFAHECPPDAPADTSPVTNVKTRPAALCPPMQQTAPAQPRTL